MSAVVVTALSFWLTLAPMARDIGQAVREVCLSFPEAEEVRSHGSPNFRVRGKTFASYTVNHHGDGRVALWLNAPRGAQEMHVSAEPKYFFVPPYVGPRGWLGVHLDKGVSWKRIAALVRSAYENSAPRPLADKIGKTIVITPPKAKLTAEQMDPMKSKRAQAVLKSLHKMVGAWPEVSQDKQFGSPVWRAGKRTFLQAHHTGSKLMLSFWVGVHRQGLLTADERFEIPKYMGHIGWISLDVTRRCDLDEVRALARESYRHFALQRMLNQELA
jgi:predicted DNA-binding protein (MmcQ/YjbR family)